MDKQRLLYLLQILSGEGLSAAEQDELKAFFMLPENRGLFIDAAQDLHDIAYNPHDNDEEKWLPFIRSIVHMDNTPPTQEADAPVVHRHHFLHRFRFYYAAAFIILILGALAYFQLERTTPSVVLNRANTSPFPKDVAPGGDRAILTLADGSVITLDSAADGKLADQEGTEIRKLSAGQIEYRKASLQTDKVMYNTMRTPRGGQYHVRLPDGTEVWLNAASSITYPTSFTGENRKVTMSGEVYFEVAANKSMPFIVSSKGMELEVVGTHFNVNAYEDEATCETTLIEGSIKFRSNNQEVLIRSGEQAQIPSNGEGKIHVAREVDLTQVMAWQKGFFQFNNASLSSIMRVVSRWYDVDVFYEGKPVNRKFGGGISKKLPLSNLLKMLERNGVNFKLEGKVLKVVD